MSDNPAFVEKLRRGDPDSVDQMVKAELPRVYNLCYRLSRNAADAEDLAQETFVHAVRGLPNFKGESLLSTWLYRIAMNVWKNRVRYERRRHTTRHISLSGPRMPDGEEQPMDLAGADRLPEQWAELQADHRLLLEAMKNLDDEDRTVLVLRDLEDRPYEEIADILNMNMGTLKSRISRAREKLRVAFRRIEGLAL
jgi:RNA polymerase sigma-70 factor, ECF subfamily